MAIRSLEGSKSIKQALEILLAYGIRLHQKGDLTLARAILERSMHLAHAVNAETSALRARNELVATGGHFSEVRFDEAYGLTRTERRVALMAASGLTNREIAKANFVQLRTVEIHLTNCYRKLGIRSRSQLRSALETKKAA
ncbi:helix-turn-helix transcriptional regulator [Streptomyces sp. NPDC013172]|uniref:helix-turn-helix transcriptional regulator n=1 Tax=Streptomyces sp. NPDC013172 TaxID=3155009 RepID=UPI0034115561